MYQPLQCLLVFWTSQQALQTPGEGSAASDSRNKAENKQFVYYLFAWIYVHRGHAGTHGGQKCVHMFLVFCVCVNSLSLHGLNGSSLITGTRESSGGLTRPSRSVSSSLSYLQIPIIQQQPPNPTRMSLQKDCSQLETIFVTPTLTPQVKQFLGVVLAVVNWRVFLESRRPLSTP